MFAKPTPGFTTAAATGDTVVLLIGMRINRFWAVHHWVPVMAAMFRMLHDLAKEPARGLRGRVLLTASPRTYYVVQYWESGSRRITRNSSATASRICSFGIAGGCWTRSWLPSRPAVAWATSAPADG
ncbi:hypothetical protein P3T37_003598 [Kitasatospora sp. MAA4]|nr:hypothetical protein [Kitasatospora sp. MAA4]